MATRLVVGAIMVDSLRHPTRVLAARRSWPPELAGLWEFPGGKVESGEGPEEALRREVREELGVDLEVGAEFQYGTGPWPISEEYALRLFFGTASRRPLPGGSHDELRWLELDRLDSVTWLPSDQIAVTRLMHGHAR